MCPLCFGPASDCTPYLVKTGSLQPRIQCKTYASSATKHNIEDVGVKFQMKTLEKSSSAAPSTNRPIVCPLCEPNLAEDNHLSSSRGSKKNKAKVRPAVWSYNMRAHLGAQPRQQSHATGPCGCHPARLQRATQPPSYLGVRATPRRPSAPRQSPLPRPRQPPFGTPRGLIKPY